MEKKRFIINKISKREKKKEKIDLSIRRHSPRIFPVSPRQKNKKQKKTKSIKKIKKIGYNFLKVRYFFGVFFEE